VALKSALEHDGDISVVGVFTNAEDAIAALPQLQPELVTMDIELPGMSGLDAVEHIMSARPVPICVLASKIGGDTERAAAALAAGALEAVDKDQLDLRDPAGPAAVKFRRRVKVLSRARVIRHPRARLAGRRAGMRHAYGASVIGVCASTGGPQILARLLEALPVDFPVPLLVVQHISAGFTDGLAIWLDRAVPLPVRVAEDGAPAEPGVWIAPEGAHLKFGASGQLVLDRDTAGIHRPSGDVLFESIAASAGSSGVAVVLTGMGRDGAAGAATVKRRGGLAIAQDEESSAVYGMPKAAVEAGVNVVLSPDGIAERLRTLCHEPLALVL
jgi:two-component system chemotaxis response regulator CheB